MEDEYKSEAQQNAEFNEMRREQQEESKRLEAIRSAEIDAHENLKEECTVQDCWICREDAEGYERAKALFPRLGLRDAEYEGAQ